MHPLAAPISRYRFAVATAVIAALTTLPGCGGGTNDESASPAQQLAKRGTAWSQLTPAEQYDALRACRLDAAVGIADGRLAEGGVARSGAYEQVVGLSADDLRAALDRRFAATAHRDERVGEGCRAVVTQAIAGAGIGRAPRVDFGAPVRATTRGLRLTVHGDAITLRARLTPSTGSLRLGPAPGRAPSSARAAITQHGDEATIHLTGVPRGRSYVRATLRAGARSWHRLLVVEGEAAPRFAPPRTFVPMVLQGRSSHGLPLLYLPRNGRATVTTDGSPLTVTAGNTVLLAHGLRADRGPALIPAGRYRDLRVTTSGAWTIRIVPAR